MDMKKQIVKSAAAAVMAISMMVSSGCTLVKFEDSGEVKKKEADSAIVETNKAVDIKSLLDEEKLSMEEKLTNEAGAEIAVYKADFPYFKNDTESAVIDKINEYYRQEFEQIEDDKERFFKIIQEKPSAYSGVRSSIFSYTLLDAPEEYVAVLRSYEGTDSLGATQKNYYCEVFSASTGWQLRFADIFGQQADKAMNVLREGLESWCFEHEYSANWLYNASDELLSEDITFDSQTLYVALPANTTPGGETLIELPMSGFEEYLSTEQQ